MACYSPASAWRTETGEVVFVERGNLLSTLTLACGNCVGCRLERSRQWSVRVMHEASCWPANSFVTLTFDDAHVPGDRSLCYSVFQRFMKRLRRHFSGRRIRFYMCGEYGEDLGRPHFHVCLFNCDFSEDRRFWRKTDRGDQVFRSPTLEVLWPYGSSEIGELTQESAAYVARYVVKKVNGDRADEHYKDVDRDTGEVTWRVPEFTRMSLRPGIGGTWFDKFASDVYPHDRVVLKGRVGKPPRYYDQLMARVDADAVQLVKEARVREAAKRFADNCAERLAVKQTVAEARLRYFKRKLK